MIRIYLLLALILAGIGAYFWGEHRGAAQCEASIATARIEAANEAREIERAQQERVHAALRKQADDLAGINTRLARDLERLRQRPERPAGVSEAPRPACQGANGAELSGADGAFLVREAARADRIRAALVACYTAYDAVGE